jgi:exodeoxyribonuclease-5
VTTTTKPTPPKPLETIHRNAGEIARFAAFVRTGGRPLDWKVQPGYTGEQVRFLPLAAVQAEGEPGQIICAFNQTRVLLNKAARRRRGYPPDRPVVKDRVMCLQNDHALGVYNGMQGHVKSIRPRAAAGADAAARAAADVMLFNSGGTNYWVRFAPEQFHALRRPERRLRGRLPFDYCYAITCHKAQGDEWDDVVVLEQRCPKWDHSRWCYTAASRARQRLTWV